VFTRARNALLVEVTHPDTGRIVGHPEVNLKRRQGTIAAARPQIGNDKSPLPANLCPLSGCHEYEGFNGKVCSGERSSSIWYRRFRSSVASPRSEYPNGTIRLVYVGALVLALSVLILGVALVRAAVVSMTIQHP